MRIFFILLIVFGCPEHVFASPWQGFTALAVSSDGQWFATGGRQGEVLWGEVETGEVVAEWIVPSRSLVVGLVFAADGTGLAVAVLDGGLWTTELPGEPLRVFSGPSSRWPNLDRFASRWTKEGPLAHGVELMSSVYWVRGSVDGRIAVRSAKSKNQSMEWQAHGAVVTGLAFLPGGRLLSAAYDGTLSVWDLLTGQFLGGL